MRRGAVPRPRRRAMHVRRVPVERRNHRQVRVDRVVESVSAPLAATLETHLNAQVVGEKHASGILEIRREPYVERLDVQRRRMHRGRGRWGRGNASEWLVYEYDPYGKLTAKSGVGADQTAADENPFRFSTKYYDAESGLYYYGYRYYSTEWGRWTSRDPAKDGTNLYGFVGNSPGNGVDSLGLKVARYNSTGVQWDLEPREQDRLEFIGAFINRIDAALKNSSCLSKKYGEVLERAKRSLITEVERIENWEPKDPHGGPLLETPAQGTTSSYLDDNARTGAYLASIADSTPPMFYRAKTRPGNLMSQAARDISRAKCTNGVCSASKAGLSLFFVGVTPYEDFGNGLSNIASGNGSAHDILLVGSVLPVEEGVRVIQALAEIGAAVEKGGVAASAFGEAMRAVSTNCGKARAITWKGFVKGSLADHFGRHGVEFGEISQNEYLKMAKAFAAEDGAFAEGQVGNIIVLYDPATRRTFVGHAGSREIRTFYRADERSVDPFQAAMDLARELTNP